MWQARLFASLILGSITSEVFLTVMHEPEFYECVTFSPVFPFFMASLKFLTNTF